MDFKNNMNQQGKRLSKKIIVLDNDECTGFYHPIADTLF